MRVSIHYSKGRGVLMPFDLRSWPIMLCPLVLGTACNGSTDTIPADDAAQTADAADVEPGDAGTTDSARAEPDALIPDALPPPDTMDLRPPHVEVATPFWTVLVPTRIDDMEPLPFLLDTGAAALMLNEELAKQVGPDPLGTVEFGGKTFHDVGFGAYDLVLPSGLLGVELGGILGYQLLGDLVLVLDYRDRLLYPLDSWDDGAYFGDHVVEPFEAVSFELAMGAIILVQARFEDIEEEKTIILDTGTSSAVVSQSLFEELGAEGDGRKILHGSKAIGAVGDVETPIFRVRSFRAGGGSPGKGPRGTGEVRKMWASVIADAHFETLSIATGKQISAIVGGGFLREVVSAIDYPASTLHVAAMADTAHVKNEFQAVGIEVVLLSGVFRVFTVFEDSDAEAKGIQVDDVLLELHGKPAASMDLDSVMSILRGEVGTSVALKLRRETTEYSVDVLRDDLLPDL